MSMITAPTAAPFSPALPRVGERRRTVLQVTPGTIPAGRPTILAGGPPVDDEHQVRPRRSRVARALARRRAKPVAPKVARALISDPSQMLAAMWIDHLGSHPSRNGFGAAG